MVSDQAEARAQKKSAGRDTIVKALRDRLTGGHMLYELRLVYAEPPIPITGGFGVEHWRVLGNMSDEPQWFALHGPARLIVPPRTVYLFAQGMLAGSVQFVEPRPVVTFNSPEMRNRAIRVLRTARNEDDELWA